MILFAKLNNTISQLYRCYTIIIPSANKPGSLMIESSSSSSNEYPGSIELSIVPSVNVVNEGRSNQNYQKVMNTTKKEVRRVL